MTTINATIINANTARGQALLHRASYNQGTTLHDIYRSYSAAKEKAYESCRRKFDEEGGKNFRITGHNCNFFTVAWDVENGVRIETATNSYFVAYNS